MKIGKRKIPLDDIITIGAGIYVGYKDGKGLPVSKTTRNLAIYGPTTATAIINPIISIYGFAMVKIGMNKVNQYKKAEIIFHEDNSKKHYKDLDSKTQKVVDDAVKLSNEITEPILSKSPFQPKLWFNKTSIIALETIASYTTGQLISRII